LILESGNALMGSGGGAEGALSNWSKMSQRAGCGPVSNGREIANMDCLLEKPVKDILEASVPADVPNAARMWGPENDAKTGAFPDAAKREFLKVVSHYLKSVSS
jgi:hypothetical protein